MGLDNQQFDRLARMLGRRQSRRNAITVIAGAAAVAAVPASRARAGNEVCLLACPDTTFSYVSDGTCEIAADYILPTPNAFCETDPNIFCDTAVGDPLGLGEHLISCYIPGQESSDCSFYYYVYDNNPDSLICPEDVTMTVDGPTAVTWDSPWWGTACTTWLDTWICDHNSGDVFPIGTTTVTCTPDFQPSGKGPDNCVFNITLNQTVPTATATEPPQAGPTSVPTEVPATEVPTAVDPTSIPADPTATTAPVTQLPNTGAGSNGSGAASKLIPVAAVGAGAALLARLGLRKSTADAAE